MWRELFSLVRSHRLVLSTALIEVRQRFAGSVFGLGWALLFPLMQLSIYATLYVFIFKVRPSGLTEYQYVLMVFSGLIPLFIFNDAVQAAAHSMTASKNLILNSSIPAEIIPLRAAIAAQIPATVGLLVTMGIGVYLQMTTFFAFLIVPIYWVLLLMFAAGLGWILSLATLVVRDIGHAIGLVLMMAMFLSPFAYTEEMVPEGLRPILHLNPLTYFVLPFQKAICFDTLPEPRVLITMAVMSVVVFLVGFARFTKSKYEFIDYA